MTTTILLVNAAVILTLAAGLWLVATRRGDPSFVDACWGLGFVVIAWISFGLADARPGRAFWLLTLTTLWGGRLGIYLYRRWRRTGPDARYEAMLARSAHRARDMFVKVFGLQAVLMLVVALPLMLGFAQVATAGSQGLHAIGVLLVLVGLAFEWTADLQLARFKAHRRARSEVLDSGVWRYSRHPNYFGDFCVWWGLFLLSTSTSLTYLGVIGPLVMSALLMRVSGVGPIEKQLRKTKPKYQDYVRRTSTFFPRPPKG